jgi:hypothetical protein
VIEFADVDARVLYWAKNVEYVPCDDDKIAHVTIRGKLCTGGSENDA